MNAHKLAQLLTSGLLRVTDEQDANSCLCLLATAASEAYASAIASAVATADERLFLAAFVRHAIEQADELDRSSQRAER